VSYLLSNPDLLSVNTEFLPFDAVVVEGDNCTEAITTENVLFFKKIDSEKIASVFVYNINKDPIQKEIKYF